MSVPSERIVAVVGAAVICEGRCLVTRRGKSQHSAGFWEFPGGKPHAGESARTALARELREELSIEVEVLASLGSSEFRGSGFVVQLEVFVCRLVAGHVELREHDALAWCDANNLAERQFSPADVPLLGAVAQYLQHDSGTL